FLSLVWMFSKTLYAVSLIQSLFTLFTVIFFLWTIKKYYRSLMLFFTIAITVYISSSYFIILEAALLTEGLFVNLLLITTTLLILALKSNDLKYWILFSASIAVTNIVRPAGLFLCGIIILLIIYFIFRKYKLKYFISLIAPFSLLIIGLCFYNYITLRAFTITPFGETNLSGVTITFIEPSPEYPQYANDAINKVLATIPKKDIPYVKNSFGVTKLYDIFLNNFHKEIYLIDDIMKQDTTKNYTYFQPVLRKIYMDALKKYPLVYAKFFLVNFYRFFVNIRKEVEYYGELAKDYKRIFVEKKYVEALGKGGWQQVSSDESDYEKIKQFYKEEIEQRGNFENISVTNSGEVEIKSTFLKSVYDVFQLIYNILFRNILWLIMFILTFSISIYRIIKSMLNETDAVIFFLIGAIFISKAMLVSLVECSIERYSYTVEYAYYMSLPFLILFFKKSKTKISSTNKL
ncbi:MAG: hypothetical protein ABIY50_01090, partial [Ignavibacteria bacterium]